MSEATKVYFSVDIPFRERYDYIKGTGNLTGN